MTSQEVVLDIIRTNPGIKQAEMNKRFGIVGYSASEQIRALRNKNLVRREQAGNTWALYPVGD